MISVSKFFLCGILFGLLSGAYSHSYLTAPQSRSDQKETETGCRGPACLGPCDVPLASSVTPATTIARGTLVNLNWPRNNHAGGFIRVAWAPTSESDTASVFNSGVQEIFCHEVGGCGPSDPTDPNGGDNAPADGSSDPCQHSITVPLSLTNGAWTMQWAWFGGAFALGDYYSCVDYVISGGPSGSAQIPLYYGGDYTYPGQNKCKFFNTDRLGQCVDEPCSNPIYTLSAEESGPAFGIAAASSTGSVTPAPPAVSVTTHAVVVPTPATTGAHAAGSSSTSTSTSSSSGHAGGSTSTSSSSGHVGGSTSTSSSSSSTSTSTSTSSSSSPCVVGYEKCVGTNQYSTCSPTRTGSAWSANQNCPTGLSCTVVQSNFVQCH